MELWWSDLIWNKTRKNIGGRWRDACDSWYYQMRKSTMRLVMRSRYLRRRKWSKTTVEALQKLQKPIGKSRRTRTVYVAKKVGCGWYNSRTCHTQIFGVMLEMTEAHRQKIRQMIFWKSSEHQYVVWCCLIFPSLNSSLSRADKVKVCWFLSTMHWSLRTIMGGSPLGVPALRNVTATGRFTSVWI